MWPFPNCDATDAVRFWVLVIEVWHSAKAAKCILKQAYLQTHKCKYAHTLKKVNASRNTVVSQTSWALIHPAESGLMWSAKRKRGPLAAVFIGLNPGRGGWANELDTNTGFPPAQPSPGLSPLIPSEVSIRRLWLEQRPLLHFCLCAF